jgi:hypothetical protein
MAKLDSIRAQAQAAATREGRAMVVLNLNQFSPMYVVRFAWDGCETDRQFVELVKPAKTPGQVAYETECVACPTYYDGSPRRSWADLDNVARASWEADPTPRAWAMKQAEA